MKNAEKIMAVGVIALFLGLATTPVISGLEIGERRQQVEEIPVEFSYYQADGKVVTKIQKLTLEELQALEELAVKLRDANNRVEALRIIKWFLTRSVIIGKILESEWLEQLPGSPIFSFGVGRKVLAKYHGEIHLKKLFNVWHYPSKIGLTVIWGEGLSMSPTQILVQRQMGFMIGFVGLYVYIPPYVTGMNSKSFFVGSASFAWGISV
jgi:hypothetical protein